MHSDRWWSEVNCSGSDPAIFDDTVKSRLRNWGRAREICIPCPVQKECLAFVLSNPIIRNTTEKTFAANHTPREITKLRRAMPHVIWSHEL